MLKFDDCVWFVKNLDWKACGKEGMLALARIAIDECCGDAWRTWVAVSNLCHMMFSHSNDTSRSKFSNIGNDQHNIHNNIQGRMPIS